MTVCFNVADFKNGANCPLSYIHTHLELVVESIFPSCKCGLFFCDLLWSKKMGENSDSVIAPSLHPCVTCLDYKNCPAILSPNGLPTAK